jgi:molybdopterin-containing oxidoreductase family membrane subunit
MIEKALKGNRSYWIWIVFLVTLVASGLSAYYQQRWFGLTVTGMGRDASFGIYTAQLTFLLGVAASAVMVVFSFSLRRQKELAKTVIIALFMAVSAALMSMLFVVADMGKPDRVLNIIFFPNPRSLVFWDLLLLSGYLATSLISGWAMLGAEHKGVPPSAWVTSVMYLSIPLAFGIATISAVLYAGLPGINLWLTAVLAIRFIASALAAGMALLILVTLMLKETTGFDAGKEAREKLAMVATYAGIANVLLLGVQFITTTYSNLPWMWFSLIIGVVSVTILLLPALRKSQLLFVGACTALVLSVWVDKSAGLMIGGELVPAPLGSIVAYAPTSTELFVVVGIWSLGTMLFTALLKVVVAVKVDNEG